ncbi:TIGR01212 family radical SAM protein [Mesoaciditoga sp.]
MYRELAPYLKEKYGARTQRISLAYFKTCPNRDGTVGVGGCTFCEESGSGFANRFKAMSVEEQMINGIEHAKKRYKAKKFIAYFQSFTNTYAPLNELNRVYRSAILENVVALDISTRPDTFPCEIAELLKDIRDEYDIDIFVEFGLESVNENTLHNVNRGHSVAEFVDAVRCAKSFDFEVIAHVILDFPYDTIYDVIGCAKLLSAVEVNGVKMHSLYISPGTQMGLDYKGGKLKPLSVNEYVHRAATFLSYLDPKIVVHRLISTPPSNALWSVGLDAASAKKRIESELKKNGKVQGSDFDYLNGASWRKKFSKS